MKRIIQAISGGLISLAPFIASASVAETVPTQTSPESIFAQLQAQINQIRSIVNELDRQVQVVVAARNAGSTTNASISAVSEESTVVAGSKAAALASLALSAPVQDAKFSSITIVLEAPEDNSQKGLSHCQLWDGSSSLTAGVNPMGSKNDTVDVMLKFNNELTIPKGTSKALKLACDVVKDPEGPATYAWRLGATSSKTITLIREGSFVLEAAVSSPVARTVKAGAKGEVATIFDFYAAGEAVDLKTLALQIDGNPRAVTAYTLWDGNNQVGGGTLSGDNVFKASLTAPFEIPKDTHKLLTVKVDIAPIGGSVAAGDTAAINFNGSQGNFNLTNGIGKSSGRGIVPSTQADTDAPALTLEL